MEISFGVLGSSHPDLEGEALEACSHLRKPHLQGNREEAHLPGQNRGLRV